MSPLYREESGGSLTEIGKLYREESDGSLTEIGKMYREESDGSLTEVYSAASTVSNLSITDTSTDCGTISVSAELTLNWSEDGDGADVTHVEVWRKTGSGGSYTEIDTVAWGTGSYVDTGVSTGFTYFYKVRVEYTDGSHSDYSNEVSAEPCA